MRFSPQRMLPLLCALLGVVVSLGSCFLWQEDDAWPRRDATCGDLFRIDGEDIDSDSLWKPHIPPEARPPQPRAAPPPPPVVAPDCRTDLALLPTETVEEGPGYLLSFALSPSGRQIAYLVYYSGNPEMRLTVRDLAAARENHFTGAWDWPFFWLDEETLLLWDDKQKAYDPKTGTYLPQPYLFKVKTGGKMRLAERWEYNYPDPARFTAPWYTGWQAAALLDLSNGELCRAAQQGLLSPQRAQDGTLLLSRGELLAVGGPLVRSWYGNLLTSAEITDLIGRARQVTAISGGPIYSSPFRPTYMPDIPPIEPWRRRLLLMVLPGSPHDLVIDMASPEIGVTLPVVPSQIPVVYGPSLVEPAAHPLFSVARDACFDPEAGGYGYVLYRKGADGGPVAPLGVIPFPYKGAEMVWSPDGQWIYFSQSALGRQSISRLRLPAP